MGKRIGRLVVVLAAVSWSYAISRGADFKYFGRDITIDADGNVYKLIYSPAYTKSDIVTVKYNREGEKVWERTFDGPAKGWDRGRAFTVDNKGNVYVAGNVTLIKDRNEPNRAAAAAIKYKADGDLSWVSYYPFSAVVSFDDYIFLNDIAVDQFGNVCITGKPVSSKEHKDGKSITVKYDKDGKEVWKTHHAGEDVGFDQVGNVYLLYDGFSRHEDKILKLSSEGKLVWTQSYPDDEIEQFVVDRSGGIVVLGFLYHLARRQGDRFYDEYDELVTYRYNSNGKQKWVRKYKDKKQKDIFPENIALDEDGNVYVCARIHEDTKESHFGHIPKPLKIEFITIKYDRDGKEQWVVKYEGAKYREGSIQGLGVDREGNVYLKGGIEHPDIRRCYVGIVIKYDKRGKRQWVTHYEETSEVARILSPAYIPKPEHTGARWFETREKAQRAALQKRIKESSDLEAKEEGYTVLQRAASEGFVDIVKMLIDKGAKVTEESLFAAVQSGHAEIVKFLAKERGEVTPDSPGVIESLIWIDEPDVFKAFLEAGLDANATDKEGKSLLHWPILYGHAEIVEMLIEAGADVNSTAPLIFRAFDSVPHTIDRDDVRIVKAFLDAGMSVELKNKHGETLLERAVKKGSDILVKVLLEAGANVNAKNNEGTSHLEWVADGLSFTEEREYLEIIKLLLDYGADVNVKYSDEYGSTPLHRAVEQGLPSIVELMLSKGADINALDSYGGAPIHDACCGDNEGVLKILIAKGADVNLKSKSGYSPLHLAVENSNNPEMIKILIKNGADINAKNNEGGTALDYAFNEEIRELLLKHGAKEE